VRDKALNVRLNDAFVFYWDADWSQLHQDGGRDNELFKKLNGRPVFGVGLFDCEAVYHVIEMREVPDSE